MENENEGQKSHISNSLPADKYVIQTAHRVNKFREKSAADKPSKAAEGDQEKKPTGGFDRTPIPPAPPGHTLKFTFHRATNLPFTDINSLSSDPFIVATLKIDLQKRHKQDPDLTFRTPTIRRNKNPEWNCEWIVAHVPASGFFLKCRIYDEDTIDHDDRLGNVHVHASGIGEHWGGIQEQAYKIKKRMGSKRAYLFRGCAAMFSREIHMSGEVFVSVEYLGRSEGNGGRAYTIGPIHWSKHFSPLIGRLTSTSNGPSTDAEGEKTRKYNFQATQIQLQGPVPASCYHRYVEFKPFVAGMFTSHTLKGRVLNYALHHQHIRIYQYDRSTIYGLFPSPSEDLTRLFLNLVHYAEGGRIFTYVLTLDAHWRFTETGKEFGIDLLSKHTMHSDVSIYVAYTGEFFVRRIKHHHSTLSQQSTSSSSHTFEQPEVQQERLSTPSLTDPSHYELIMDNDSGTYRPSAKCLPALREFMSANLPGLKINTLDCQVDAKRIGRLKDEKRERKKKEGQNITYLQGNLSSDSFSSSDEEELEARAQGSKQKSKVAKGVQNVKKPEGKLMKWVGGQPAERSAATQGKTKMTEEGSEVGEKTMDSPPVRQNQTTGAPTEEEKPSAEDKPPAQDKLAAEHSLLVENKLLVQG